MRVLRFAQTPLGLESGWEAELIFMRFNPMLTIWLLG
jgi:hypothetical protein